MANTSYKDIPVVKRVLTIGRYFRQKFGSTVRKVPLSISGFTCPNMDGKVSEGGCIYCKNESFSPNFEEGSAPFTLTHEADNPYLKEQLADLENQYVRMTEQFKNKYQTHKFLPYFQSFTNTYAPFGTLKALYEKAFSLPGSLGCSIGTRSDSVQDEVLDFLASHVKKKEIWVEYGIQSAYNETLEHINRAETIEQMEMQVRKTKEKNLNVCVHLIFGLPGETPEMMLHSVKKMESWGISGIKFHPLYIVRNTRLESEYNNGNFTPITLDQYAETLCEALDILSPEVVIQRVTAGVDDDTLVAPDWCEDNKAQMDYIRKALRKKGILY